MAKEIKPTCESIHLISAHREELPEMCLKTNDVVYRCSIGIHTSPSEIKNLPLKNLKFLNQQLKRIQKEVEGYINDK